MTAADSGAPRIDTARLRDIADLDSRAGGPVGNALREAADEIDRLRDRLAEVEDDHSRMVEWHDQQHARAEAAEAKLAAVEAEMNAYANAYAEANKRLAAAEAEVEAALARVLAIPEAETVAPNVWVSGYNTALRNVRAAAEGDDR